MVVNFDIHFGASPNWYCKRFVKPIQYIGLSHRTSWWRLHTICDIMLAISAGFPPAGVPPPPLLVVVFPMPVVGVDVVVVDWVVVVLADVVLLALVGGIIPPNPPILLKYI